RWRSCPASTTGRRAGCSPTGWSGRTAWSPNRAGSPGATSAATRRTRRACWSAPRLPDDDVERDRVLLRVAAPVVAWRAGTGPAGDEAPAGLAADARPAVRRHAAHLHGSGRGVVTTRARGGQREDATDDRREDGAGERQPAAEPGGAVAFGLRPRSSPV